MQPSCIRHSAAQPAPIEPTAWARRQTTAGRSGSGGLRCPRDPHGSRLCSPYVQSVDLRIAQSSAIQPIRCSCAVLCCAVLCCAVLCCAVLCCAVLCCAVLCAATAARAVAAENNGAASLARLLAHTAAAAQAQHSAMPFHTARQWRAGLPLGGPQWPLYCQVVAAAHTTLWFCFRSIDRSISRVRRE
jgi:hypothetical protein